ncbi:hypothetical protein ABK040_002349 [Willaertia magna]
MSSTQAVDEVLNLLSYPYSARVRKDVLHLISNIPLIVKVGKMNGTKDLMQLTGTIPMYYKGSRYNIPMTFWIVEMYPYHPPICYVSPTPNMVIKQKHKHVDATGKCYLPYLANWNPSSSDLYELVNQLSAVFGSEPPVYQKSSSTSGSSNNLTSSTTNPLTSSTYLPSNTPPPFTNPTMNPTINPTINPTMNPTSGGIYQQPSYYGTGTTTTPPPFTGATTVTPNPYPTNSSFYLPNTNNPMMNSSTYGMNTSGYNMGGYQHNLPPVPRKPTIDELKEKLLLKVKTHLQNVTVREYSAKIDTEFQMQNKLNEREKQLEMIEQRMKLDLEQFEKDEQNLVQKKTQIESWIENNENKPIDVDTIINPQDIQSKQILELNSEEMAIDDVVYYLDKKLHAKQISLDDWLNQVRELSRQQFMKKALIKKMATMQ